MKLSKCNAGEGGPITIPQELNHPPMLLWLKSQTTFASPNHPASDTALDHLDHPLYFFADHACISGGNGFWLVLKTAKKTTRTTSGSQDLNASPAADLFALGLVDFALCQHLPFRHQPDGSGLLAAVEAHHHLDGPVGCPGARSQGQVWMGKCETKWDEHGKILRKSQEKNLLNGEFQKKKKIARKVKECEEQKPRFLMADFMDVVNSHYIITFRS